MLYRSGASCALTVMCWSLAARMRQPTIRTLYYLLKTIFRATRFKCNLLANPFPLKIGRTKPFSIYLLFNVLFYLSIYILYEYIRYVKRVSVDNSVKIPSFCVRKLCFRVKKPNVRGFVIKKPCV